jgi:hypothetical protein
METITFENYFVNTFAVFKDCKTPKSKPDYISYSYGFMYNEISSRYWYKEDSKGKFVIRESDHWVRIKHFNRKPKITQCSSIASCNWSIKTTIIGGRKSAKCYLTDFKRNY